MPALFPHLNEWGPMVWPQLSWLEKLVRPTVVYLFLLVAFRFSGKRELSQSTLFDFLVVLLISNVVQNAMIGNDNSIAGSFAGVASLLTLTWVLNKLTSRSRHMRQLLQGSPTLLVHDGRVLEDNMKNESVARNDLLMALREQGIATLTEVRFAVLELDGKISIIKTDAPKATAAVSCVIDEIIAQDHEG